MTEIIKEGRWYRRTVHYYRMYKEVESGCWEWQGQLDIHGYGVYRHQQAHRLSYLMWVGDIPESFDVDHLRQP